MPRLKDDAVFIRALAAGVATDDFFGLAYGTNDAQYSGLIIGQATSPIFDGSLLIVAPEAALTQKAAALAAKQALAAERGVVGTAGTTGTTTVVVREPGGHMSTVISTGGSTQPASVKPAQTRFYGVVELDAVTAKLQFAKVVDEVIQLFSTKPGVNLTIRVDIEAGAAAGFDENMQRAVRENSKVLKFKSSDFEGGE